MRQVQKAFAIDQTPWCERRDTEASGANRVESWYIKFTCFPIEASLLRPTEFAWPPGIQALLLIRGFKAALDLIGDMEPLELFIASFDWVNLAGG